MELQTFKRFIDPLKRKLALTISRAVIKAVKDDPKIQRVQIALLKDEVRDSIERFQNYGFSSVPKDGAEALTVFIGGDRSHGIVIACDDRRYRLNGLKGGEVALYTDEGDSIVLKRGNEITIKTKILTINSETKIDINTPKATFSNDVDIKGKLNVLDSISSVNNISTILGDIVTPISTFSDFVEKYNEHNHNETDSVTGQPNQQI